MKICLAGEGAQGATYMNSFQSIEQVEVVSLAGGLEKDTADFARNWNIPHYALDLETCLKQPGVEAVFLTTPSQLHAEQVKLALAMGKHVLVEIPMALNLRDAEELVELEEKTGLTCMVAHTRHYSRVMREVHRRVSEGELHLHHLIFQTYFFRRENLNRFGKPRTWTDDLLWHHGCHTIDVVHWLLQDPDIEVWGQCGPHHPVLDIPMDISIGMKSRHGSIVTASLSFNNHGPIELIQRYIGEEETLRLEQRNLVDSEGNIIIEDDFAESFVVQNREFLDAIDQGRKPETNFSNCLPVMRILDRIKSTLE